MKTFGIIGAMDEEISELKPHMEIVNAKNITGIDFFFGKMAGKTVVLARSGIGKVNAAVCAQIMIDMYAVDYIINVGVAGACGKELNIGDIVISDDLVQHDFDAGDAKGLIPRLDITFFKADEELKNLAKNEADASLNENRAYVGRIASGDQFINDADHRARIWNSFKPLCVEMEGAAVAHACYLNKIPFVVIRAISDNADGKAEISFEKFAVKAAAISSAVVARIIEKFE